VNISLACENSKAGLSHPLVWSSRWFFIQESIIFLAISRGHTGYKAFIVFPA